MFPQSPLDKMGVLDSVFEAPFPDFFRDAYVRFLVMMVFRYANGTASDWEKDELNYRRKILG